MYFEFDAVVEMVNPFPDLNAEDPTLAAFKGKAVKVLTLILDSLTNTLKKLCSNDIMQGFSRDEVKAIMEMYRIFHHDLMGGFADLADAFSEHGRLGKHSSWRQHF